MWLEDTAGPIGQTEATPKEGEKAIPTLNGDICPSPGSLRDRLILFVADLIISTALRTRLGSHLRQRDLLRFRDLGLKRSELQLAVRLKLRSNRNRASQILTGATGRRSIKALKFGNQLSFPFALDERYGVKCCTLCRSQVSGDCLAHPAKNAQPSGAN